MFLLWCSWLFFRYCVCCIGCHFPICYLVYYVICDWCLVLLLFLTICFNILVSFFSVSIVIQYDSSLTVVLLCRYPVPKVSHKTSVFHVSYWFLLLKETQVENKGTGLDKWARQENVCEQRPVKLLSWKWHCRGNSGHKGTRSST